MAQWPCCQHTAAPRGYKTRQVPKSSLLVQSQKTRKTPVLISAYQYFLCLLKAKGDEVTILTVVEWALSGFVTEDAVAFLLAFLNALKQDALLEGKRNSLCFVFKGDSSESLRGHLHCPLLATPGKALSTRRAPCFLMPGLRLACFGWKALRSPRILFPPQILIVYGSPHAKVLRFHPKNI